MSGPGSEIKMPKEEKTVVDRQTERDLIRSEIVARLDGPRRDKSVWVLFGMDGIGKSTLLIQTILPDVQAYSDPALPHALIDLADPGRPGRYVGPFAVGNLVVDLVEQLAASVGLQDELPYEFAAAKQSWETLTNEATDAQVDERQERLFSVFNEQVVDLLLLAPDDGLRPLVILLDSAEQLDTDALELVQTELQAPTTQTGYVLWVMASRYRLEGGPFYLRDDYEWHEVGPFDIEQVREQLGNQAPELAEAAEQVHDFSQGVPKATAELAERLQRLAEQESAEQSLIELIDQHEIELVAVLDDLLEASLAQRDIRSGEERGMRAAVDVLSPLRQLSLSMVNHFAPLILARANVDDTWAADPLRLNYRLRRAKLIDWDDRPRSEVFEEPIRRIAARILESRDDELFRRIHREAAAKYEEWMHIVSEKRFDYLIEAIYHEAVLALRSANTPPPQAEVLADLERLVQSFVDEYYPQRPDHEKNDAERRKLLRNQIKSDPDLTRLLGEKGMAHILQIVASTSDLREEVETRTTDS